MLFAKLLGCCYLFRLCQRQLLEAVVKVSTVIIDSQLRKLAVFV